MQITLKQSDIEKSLKEFITAQGIRTEGKKVEIHFTAGRRGTGVMAEVSIEDVCETKELIPVLVEVPQDCGSDAPEPVTEPANDEEAIPVKTTSLFG